MSSFDDPEEVVRVALEVSRVATELDCVLLRVDRGTCDLTDDPPSTRGLFVKKRSAGTLAPSRSGLVLPFNER